MRQNDDEFAFHVPLLSHIRLSRASGESLRICVIHRAPLSNSEGCQRGSARPLAGTSLRSCARLLRNLRGFPPKVSLSAAHSRFASASRHRTAFLLQGDFLWLRLRRRGLERAVYTTPSASQMPLKHICHLLAAESCGAPGVTLVKPFCQPSEFLSAMCEKRRCARIGFSCPNCAPAPGKIWYNIRKLQKTRIPQWANSN